MITCPPPDVQPLNWTEPDSTPRESTDPGRNEPHDNWSDRLAHRRREEIFDAA